MVRLIIDYRIKTCPHCGYCAGHISKEIQGASEVVNSDSYQKQLNSTEFPKKANAFLCASLIQANINNYTKAGSACMHAAWVCDDAGYQDARFVDAARECRRQAIALLQKAKENGQSFGAEPGAEETLLVDLYRRSGQFELARSYCDEGLKKKPKKIIKDILRFQQKLIDKGDTECHNVSEFTSRID